MKVTQLYGKQVSSVVLVATSRDTREMQKLRPSPRTCSSFSIDRRKTLDLTRGIVNQSIEWKRDNARTSEKNIAAIDVRRRIFDVHDAKIFSFEYRSNRVDLKRGRHPCERKQNESNVTSFNLPGNGGRHISATPSQTTAVSSTNTPSGKDSSAGNSITSKPSFLK